MGSLELRNSSAKEKAPLREPALRRTPENLLKRWLRCRRCGACVTAEDDRVQIDGRHDHRRTNPAGLEFAFGCFRAAPGARVVGEPTFEFTWFGGYRWAFSLCLSCNTHLGWYFTGRDPAFFGLILDRLEVEPTPESA